MSGMFGVVARAGGHKSVEWYTPAWIFEALALRFDLDPCSPHDVETAVPAARKIDVFENGLTQPWSGRVFLNPPYGYETGLWMRRMIDHANGIALVFSRTDSEWCQAAMRSAHTMLFLAGRIEFVPGVENRHKRSRVGAATLMLAWGGDCAVALRRLREHGVLLECNPSTIAAPAAVTPREYAL